ncbi:altronate dehydratase family protein [Paenibacillus oenotherae]|uniref:Altronate dehydratase family protein n=1 Tax=Paenibacillus oenotherae TaxID=1435645 RepID=A0ABS7DBW5_9BACL|nr:altronate dehydratase family protein [Paenibacillus oenotherae]MBW7477264.1 altronate dehydratase family protein [Paenibacillus oenotherae]
MNDTLVIHPSDDVAIALRAFSAGEMLRYDVHGRTETVAVINDVPRGHKISLRPLPEGSHIHKFGYSIGIAKEDIVPGSWVHTHNLRTGLGKLLDYTYTPAAPEREEHNQSQQAQATFQGYIRANGEVGIRNEIWIINTVGCINKTCERLASMATKKYGDRAIDGILHFAHPFGCSQLGDDLLATQKLLAALACHPNAAAVLVVGLGCENNTIDSFKALLGDIPEGRIKFMKSQEVEDELETGMALIDQLVDYAETFTRTAVPLSKLKIGLKCGGSDGFSGITANPLVGTIADAVTAEGGTALLSEVPEMFGAETILMERAKDENVFTSIVTLINGFKDYFIRHGQEIYENPSPGNKDGGISTLEEKSLGCTQKGGHAVVTDVLRYAERSQKPGLNLVQAPGNDLVSVTALSAAGAHIVLFTTGRGTPFGGPVPTLKIATNSVLAERKRNWIDYNAGQLIEGHSMDSMRDELLALIISIASGEAQTRNEENGFREIAIFKDGVIL